MRLKLIKKKILRMNSKGQFTPYKGRSLHFSAFKHVINLFHLNNRPVYPEANPQLNSSRTAGHPTRPLFFLIQVLRISALNSRVLLTSQDSWQPLSLIRSYVIICRRKKNKAEALDRFLNDPQLRSSFQKPDKTAAGLFLIIRHVMTATITWDISISLFLKRP